MSQFYLKAFSFSFTFYFISFQLLINLPSASFYELPDQSQVEFISQQIEKLPPDSFSEDQILTQDVDSSSSQSLIYTLDFLGKTIPIFQTNAIADKGKSVVVLQNGADRLPMCRDKKTFVVLKQSKDKPSSYHVLLAYIKETNKGRSIEWGTWKDQGLAKILNKANLFGWTKCSYSSLIPCKPELQTILPANTIPALSAETLKNTSISTPENPEAILDFFCDLQPIPKDETFVGATVDVLINSMVILSGVQLIYQNEDKLVSEVAKDLKNVVPQSQVSEMGRSFFGNSKDPDALDIASELGAKKFIQKGREGIANAVMTLDALISNIGAIAKGYSFQAILDSSKDLVQDKDKQMGAVSRVGKTLLRGLFEGASTENKDEKFLNPNPKALLKDDVVEELISLKKISSERFLGRLFGFNFFGSPPPPPPPPQIVAPPGEQWPDINRGIPVNITVGNQKVLVIGVKGGMYLNNRFVKGKFERGALPDDIIFIPEVPAGAPQTPGGYPPPPPASGGYPPPPPVSGGYPPPPPASGGYPPPPPVSGGYPPPPSAPGYPPPPTTPGSYPPSPSESPRVPINVTLDGNVVTVLVVTGGIMVNGQFKKGHVQNPDSGDPTVFKFVPEEEAPTVTTPDGRQGVKTTIKYKGQDVEAIQVDDGVFIDGKFIKGNFKKGTAGTGHYMIPPPPQNPPPPSSQYPSPPPSPQYPPPPPSSQYPPPPPSSQYPPPPPSSQYPPPPPSSPPGNDTKPEPPIAYFIYFDNSTSSKPFVVYVIRRGFLFYGLFFPGHTIDDQFIEINGQIFRAEPIDRNRIHKGLMFPPMPPTYTITYNTQIKIVYYVITGFILDTYYIEGKEVPGGIELNGQFFNATIIPPDQSPVVPGMAGAYQITIQGKLYLAFIVHQGVIIGGIFFPAKILSDGIEIQGVLYPGTYITYVGLKPNTLYTVIEYYEVHVTILTIITITVEEIVDFTIMYNFDTAFGPPPTTTGLSVQGGLNLNLQGSVTLPGVIDCPPGQQMVAPLGIPPKVATDLMQRDLASELIKLLDWKPLKKTGQITGSTAVDNLGSVLYNSFDWYGDKSAGETFQENLIGGFWTPFGLADDIVDTLGFFTGAGKVSDDYGYIDDLFGMIVGGVGGVAGKVIDGVGFFLNPIGLGGVWKSVAGIASGALGIVAGAKSLEVYGVYDLIKLGAKTVHLGWALGLRGSESEKRQKELTEKIEKLQTVKAYLLAHPPQCTAVEFTPGQTISANLGVSIGAGASVGIGTPGSPYGAPSPAPGYPYAAPQPPTGGSGFSLNAGASFGLSAGVNINSGYRKKRADQENTTNSGPFLITDVDLFSHVGWRTMAIKQDTLSNALEVQKEPFVGIGACDYIKPTEKELETVSNPKQLVEYLMRAMKTQCLSAQRDSLLELITFKHLRMTPEKTFSTGQSLMKKEKLNSEDLEQLSKAFEIEIFSEAYTEILKSKSASYDNNAFLKKFVAKYIFQTQNTGAQHSIKLLRNLIKTLQTLLTKSLQDFYRYKFCPKCQEDLIRIVMNDPIEIIGLIEFLSTTIHTGNNAEEIQSEYEKWFILRKDELQKKLQLYLV